MSMADVAATVPINEPAPRRQTHPTGFEPGVTFTNDGAPSTATITSHAPIAAEDHRATIEAQTRLTIPAHLDVQIERLTLQNGASGDVERWWYKYKFIPRQRTENDIDALVKAAKRSSRNTAPAIPTCDTAFVVALGDLQLGKVDGDGVEGTVERFLATTQAAVARYKRVAKGSPVYLIHLGDCIEGMVSQGGANTWRTSLTTTEQVRLYRRLLLEQIKAFANVAPQMVVVGVPGNHDEAHRPLHTYGDSWATDAVSAVRDALELAGGYEHVTLHVPERDELTVTLDVCGTRIGMAHGHQFGRGADGWKNWWKGQQHGRQPIGDADILLAGHYHHLRIQRDGTNGDSATRTFIQTPALESESTWWRHRSGEGGDPGIVTFLTGEGRWWGLEVL